VLREREIAVCTWHFVLVEKGANGGQKEEFVADRRPPRCWRIRKSAANKKPLQRRKEDDTPPLSRVVG
jgi:hypothetical protein